MTYTGYLQIEVGKRLNKSVITNSYYDGVLKITKPTYVSETLPLLTLIHVGGGYVDGDSYLTEVTLNKSASLALTTQAATKVYKSPRFGASQTMNYVLKEESALYVRQDSLILYKHARFIQNTNVYMSSTSTFSYMEIITPGWSADGKFFQYKKLTSKLRVFVDGKLAVFDHLLLQPSDGLEELLYLEGYTHIGTMLFLDKRVNAAFVDELREELLEMSEKARIGISLLSVNGLSIRILANTTDCIESIFTECETYINQKLLKRERLE